MAEADIVKLAQDPELKEAIIARYRAEATKFQAEALHVAAMTRGTNAEAEQSEIDLAKAHREETAELAGDKYYKTYAFTRAVDDGSVSSCIERLSFWSRTEPGCEITIIFNSPGGGVIAGLALFDFIMQLRRTGHNVTTLALGHAASMAGILLQAGDVRVMGKESWLLIHEIQFSAIGKIGEIEDTTKWVKKIQRRVLEIFAARSKLSVRQLEKRWKRQDWWIDSDEALKLGLVDEVR